MIHFCADVRMITNSGIGVYIRNYILSIIKSQKYIVTLLGRREELDVCFKEYKNWNYIEADFPIYSVEEQLRLPIIIPKCDVFWSPHYNIPLLPIKAKYHLVTIPDVYHLAYYKTLSLSQKIYAKLTINLAVRKAAKLITISNYSKEQILFFTLAKKDIQVIYLGIDNNLFNKSIPKSLGNQVREKYKLPDSFILFVGNVKPNKNLRGLVKAFEQVVGNIPDAVLVITGKADGFITGDPSLFEYIAKSERLKNKIVFTGFVDTADLPVMYSLAKLFVFPSVYEGFGFPPLEAMACGCATVVSKAASIPEICGEASYYVDPNDPNDIALGIETALTNSDIRDRLVSAGNDQCRKYNWNDSSSSFMSVIDSFMLQ